MNKRWKEWGDWLVIPRLNRTTVAAVFQPSTQEKNPTGSRTSDRPSSRGRQPKSAPSCPGSERSPVHDSRQARQHKQWLEIKTHAENQRGRGRIFFLFGPEALFYHLRNWEARWHQRWGATSSILATKSLYPCRSETPLSLRCWVSGQQWQKGSSYRKSLPTALFLPWGEGKPLPPRGTTQPRDSFLFLGLHRKGPAGGPVAPSTPSRQT